VTWFTDAEKIPARYPTAKPEEKPISKRALKNAGHRTRGEGSKPKDGILKSRRCREAGPQKISAATIGGSAAPYPGSFHWNQCVLSIKPKENAPINFAKPVGYQLTWSVRRSIRRRPWRAPGLR